MTRYAIVCMHTNGVKRWRVNAIIEGRWHKLRTFDNECEARAELFRLSNPAWPSTRELRDLRRVAERARDQTSLPKATRARARVVLALLGAFDRSGT